MLARRRKEAIERMTTSLEKLQLEDIVQMKWEENDLDYMVGTLGLEDGLCGDVYDGRESEDDWLEDWQSKTYQE